VDHRSDVYSLGKLMQEALEGQAISRGLRDILAKCVARRPEDRYADAAGLAADLRRHLASKPLVGVPNRDPLEAVAKWNRRHPAALLWASVVLALAGVAAALGAMALTPKPDEASRRRGVEALAAELRRQRAEGSYHRALFHAATGDLEAAAADCDRALTLEPALAEAALQRGVVRYRQGRHAEALVDLERAERGGADAAAAAYNQALVRTALGELTEARACVQRALRHRPDHAAAQQLARRLEGDHRPDR
jgi:tetratricopeptide (TPR) repeat protein